ncbi:MAG TPA: hypothetical protein ENO16_07435 [Chromatiales bacterium]|nr:hypothetical protein [Chromatiales bacterium]
MRIVTPMEVEEVAWEGYLEPAGEVYPSAALPKVTVGEPTWWAAGELEAQTGKKWSAPAGGARYNLLRLACTLHPPERGSAYADATLSAYLRPAGGGGQAIAHDMYPVRETAERKGTFNISVGPDLKFGPVEAGVAEAGLEIELHKVFPVVQAFGLGEPNPYWKFERHSANPLLGSQYVYAVVAAPAGARALRLVVELVATVDSGWMPMRFKTPEQAQAHISRSLPLSQKEGGEAAVAPGREPNVTTVRALLQAAFSPATLTIFCQDRPAFRPLVDRFSPRDGLMDMVARVIDYCQEQYLWEELLDEVKMVSPRQWKRFEGQVWG